MSSFGNILDVFLQEGAECLETLNALVLKLEAAPHDADLLKQAMRTAHNLKGASATVGLSTISEVAHKVEEVVQRLCDGSIVVRPALFDELFRTLDVLTAALAQVSGGQAEPPVLRERLLGLGAVLGEEPAAADALREAAASRFVLGEYDHIRLRVLRQQGKALVEVTLPVPEGEADAAKWARSSLRALKKLLDVVTCYPPETSLEEAGDLGALSILCGTLLAPSALAQSLSERGVDCTVAPAALGEVEPAAERSKSASASTAPSAAADAKGAAATHKAHGSLKVDLERVDNLVDMLGELVIVQSMVASAPEITAITSRQVHNSLAQLTRITRDLQDAGLRLRMVPLSGIFQTLARSVRDTARKLGKDVTFVASGDDVEMDRSVVERIADPLMHLVRNAVDHGLESPEERRKAGKPVEACIRLAAYHQGGGIVIDVSDDGRGLDKQAILETGRRRGLVREGAIPSEHEIHALIFEDGFSTSASVTDLSGRGVGLDIVRRNVEAMRGRVTVLSEPGRGTTFRMMLPLTLAIIDGMLVACGRERYVIPTIAIVESLRPKAGAVLSVGGTRKVLNLRGGMLPLVSLGDLFHASGARSDPTEALVVVLEGTGRRVGIVVDEVISQQQVVIKNVGEGLGSTRYLSGAAILPDGRVGLILNIDDIVGSQDVSKEGGSELRSHAHSEAQGGTN